MKIYPAELVSSILASHKTLANGRSLMVGISGIDASGKGLIAAKLERRISSLGLRVATINADAWLNLPSLRFNPVNPAAHFYENALRLDEMFERLVLPLKQNRCVKVSADLASETASEYKKHKYSYTNKDIILLEGIFIFKNRYTRHFDLRIWIDCSFETALERAINRRQEGLSPTETVKAYQTIYFPAQRIHFDRDAPQRQADIVFDNDQPNKLICSPGRRKVFSLACLSCF